MSKKLLMNNYSENGLMPVMDGLVCWLDAKNVIDNRLVDKSGNNNYMDIIGSYKVINNELDVLSKAWTRINPEHTINLSNDFTLMFKVRIKSNPLSPWGRVLTMSKTGTSNLETLRFEYGTSSRIVYANNKNWGNIMPLSQLCDIVVKKSGTNVELKINKNIYYTYQLTNFSADTYKEIGFNCENLRHEHDVDMTIHNFLFYNRALTEEEIQHNYKYEQSIKRGDDV